MGFLSGSFASSGVSPSGWIFSFVSGFETSSIPMNSPSPRTSPMTGCLSCIPLSSSIM